MDRYDRLDDESYDDQDGEDNLQRKRNLADGQFDEVDPDADPPEGYTTGETDVDISMEVDADGNEVWYAKDSEIPGSSSMGHSLEEAMDGMDDRRRQYREMLKKSREKRKRRQRGE